MSTTTNTTTNTTTAAPIKLMDVIRARYTVGKTPAGNPCVITHKLRRDDFRAAMGDADGRQAWTRYNEYVVSLAESLHAVTMEHVDDDGGESMTTAAARRNVAAALKSTADFLANCDGLAAVDRLAIRPRHADYLLAVAAMARKDKAWTPGADRGPVTRSLKGWTSVQDLAEEVICYHLNGWELPTVQQSTSTQNKRNAIDNAARKAEEKAAALARQKAAADAAAKAEADRLAADKESKRGGADTVADPVAEMGGMDDRNAVKAGEARPIRSGKKSGKKSSKAAA